MDNKIIEKLELNKILAAVAKFAVLSRTKDMIVSEVPSSDAGEAEKFLDLTQEADLALFRHGVGRIEEFPEDREAYERAQKGATLSCKELLGVALLLRSASVKSCSRVRGCRASVWAYANGGHSISASDAVSNIRFFIVVSVLECGVRKARFGECPCAPADGAQRTGFRCGRPLPAALRAFRGARGLGYGIA